MSRQRRLPGADPARPLVGFVAGYDEDRPFFERPASLLRAAGANLVMLAHTADEGHIEDYIGLVDAIVIGGGVEDIAPHWYGQEPHPALGPVDPVRDRFDLYLARACIERDVPLLGICRGAQAINVVLGGALTQDLASHSPHSGALHSGEWTDFAGFCARPHMHAVAFESDSIFRTVLGAQSEDVCSYHHQAIARLGDGLAVAARADDGVVEAIEHRDSSFCFGVQWHPELAQESAVNRLIVAELARCAIARRAQRLAPKRRAARRAA